VKERQEALNKEQINQQDADRVEITYYTDPLCCWSWAFEPQWRKLQFEFEGKLTWRYCMGGLLPSWKNYHDEMNSVSRPIQMGPVWMHASQLSGMPMNTLIWMKDPPASSYPTCIAVKCVKLQSSQLEERYLRLLREAVMINGINISKQSVLMELAQQLQKEYPSLFDIEKFKQDLVNDIGLELFRKDLQEIQYRNIPRFPSLILKHSSHNPIIITGYRPYEVLLEALNTIAPHFTKRKQGYSKQDYQDYWHSITQREIDEI
jgi:predicted DsbA family dithiol-disulfide isomerase